MKLDQEKIKLLYISKKQIKIGKNKYQFKMAKNCDGCFLIDRKKGCLFFKCGIKNKKVVPGGICLPVKNLTSNVQYDNVIKWIENNLVEEG